MAKRSPLSRYTLEATTKDGKSCIVYALHGNDQELPMHPEMDYLSDEQRDYIESELGTLDVTLTETEEEAQ